MVAGDNRGHRSSGICRNRTDRGSGPVARTTRRRKVYAYTRIYQRGRASSRAKDPVDIVLVKQMMVLDASRLRAALVGVFERTASTSASGSAASAAAGVVGAVPQTDDPVGINPDLRTGYVEATALLDPICLVLLRADGTRKVLDGGDFGSLDRLADAEITVPNFVPYCAQNCALSAYRC